MQDAAQVSRKFSLLKLKNKLYQHIWMSKEKKIVCAMSDCMGTILQVTKCTGVPCQMLFAQGLSEFFFNSFQKHRYWKKLLLDTDLQVKFYRLTILLKYEAWSAEGLQIGVFKLKELLSLVRPWATKETKSSVNLGLSAHTSICICICCYM